MRGDPEALYALARRTLIDALELLEAHRDAVILVGAQAIYLHTGEADVAVAPTTKDADLALLGETVGIDLELEAQERNVGPFRADILCKDTATNHWVLIENQLERTDHTHLGQLLTYAAGLDAVTIVWIAADFTDEHRAALDWLNEKTEDSVDFFGLEIELWRIGDSPPAPKFNVVSKPNNWSATVAGGVRRIETTELTPTKELQYEYWEAFRKALLERGFLRPPPARPTHEMDIALGRAGIVLRARLTSREKWIQAAVVIMDRQRNAFWFGRLEDQKDKIDQELGFGLTWNGAAVPRENRIYVRLPDTNFRDRSNWPRQHA